MAPFDRSHTSSYWRFLVIMALSCIISEIKWDIGWKFENHEFFIPHLHSTPQLGGPRRNIALTFGLQKLQRWFYLLVKFIKHNLKLLIDVSTSIRGLHQKKLVLSSSGTWNDGKTSCQESGRMRGSVGSCPHHGCPFGCVWPLWSTCWNSVALCRSPSPETSWWRGSLALRGRICCVLLNLMHEGF